jgi:hypothetical protein
MSKTRDRIQAIAAAAGTAVARDEDADSPRVQAFLRGVSIGALVGAAIAGSAIWERSQRRRAKDVSLAVDGDARRTEPPHPTD